MKRKIYTLTLLFLCFDQFVKMLVMKGMELGDTISIMPNFFSLTYVQNTGGAWSIFQGQVWFLTIVSGIVLIFFNQYLAKQAHFRTLEMVSYGMIMGGILGNFIDRLIHQAVIDFLSFRILGYDFPVFNIADIAIVVGLGLLMIDTIRGEKNGIKIK